MFKEDFLSAVETIIIGLILILLGIIIANAICPREIADSNCIVYNEKLYCERSE